MFSQGPSKDRRGKQRKAIKEAGSVGRREIGACDGSMEVVEACRLYACSTNYQYVAGSEQQVTASRIVE